MNINQDFKFRDDIYKPDSAETVPIEITTGPYSGVVYRYVRVGVKEKDDGEAVMQFQYELLEMGNHTETALRADHRFTKHIGLVLNQLILESLEGENDGNGEGNLKEPDVQSGILS